MRPGLTAYKLFRMESCGIKHDAASGNGSFKTCAPVYLYPQLNHPGPLCSARPWRRPSLENFEFSKFYSARIDHIGILFVHTLNGRILLYRRNRFHFSQARESFEMLRIFPIIFPVESPPLCVSRFSVFSFDSTGWNIIYFLKRDGR